MKISLAAKDGNGFSQNKAQVKASGDRSLLIPLLKRALELAEDQTNKWDATIREIQRGKQ